MAFWWPIIIKSGFIQSPCLIGFCISPLLHPPVYSVYFVCACSVFTLPLNFVLLSLSHPGVSKWCRKWRHLQANILPVLPTWRWSVCVCVCAVMFAFMFVFVSAHFPASVLATFFFFSCRCQHLRALPVQCIWHRTHRIHKVWGLLYTHSFPLITSQLFDTHLPYASLIQFVILYLLRSPSGLCNSSVHPAERFCHWEATVDL